MSHQTPMPPAPAGPCPLPGKGLGTGVAGLLAVALLTTPALFLLQGGLSASGQDATTPLIHASLPADRGPARVERRLGSMGTGLAISVWGSDRSTCLKASETAVRALEQTEARLSTWIETSEFSALNHSPLGQWQDLSPATAADLQQALHLSSQTKGHFNPTLGRLIQAWDLRGDGQVPTESERLEAIARIAPEGIEVHGLRARRTADVILEEGAFGKGAGLDKAMSALRQAGVKGASLNLGGQWAFVGSGTWPIQLAHPTKRSEAVLTLNLSEGSLATSANSERHRIIDGQEVGHLLDPTTGMPLNASYSVSVFASSALLADALSTALFIAPAQAASFAEEFGVEVIVLEPTKRGLTIHLTPGLMANCRPLAVNLRVISLQPNLDL